MLSRNLCERCCFKDLRPHGSCIRIRKSSSGTTLTAGVFDDDEAIAESAGFVFSSFVFNGSWFAGNEWDIGLVVGIETSLSRCEPAPVVVPLEASRSLISIGSVGCAVVKPDVEAGLGLICGVPASPAAPFDCVEVAIGRLAILQVYGGLRHPNKHLAMGIGQLVRVEDLSSGRGR